MKKINKIIGSVLALIALFFVVKVNAVTITTDSNRKGTVDAASELITNRATLTITGIQTGDSFKAYKLLNAFYNSASNEITYEFTDSFKNYLMSIDTYKNYTVDQYFQLTSGDKTSGSTKTTSSLDKMISGYVAYIKTNSVVGTDMTINGNSVSASLEAGAYFVLPVSTNKVYAVMVGNIEFSANNSEWVLNNESIVAKVSDAGLTKTVSGIANKNLISTEFTYNLVGTVPQYPTNAVNRTYTIEDTLSQGITFSGVSSLVIKDGNTALNIDENGNVTNSESKTVATVTFANQKLTINCDVNNIKSTLLTVSYKAKMNENAVIGDAGNKNSATLTYSNSPYTTDNITSTPIEVITQVYGIELLSYGGADKNLVLENAQFDVYSDEALTTKVGSINTDSQGIGRLKGLTEGTYYLKATKAPAGYQLLKDKVPVKVKVSGSIDGETAGYYRTEISNAVVGILPYTGGLGLLIYSLIGIVIIGIGTYITIKIQKKKVVNEK